MSKTRKQLIEEAKSKGHPSAHTATNGALSEFLNDYAKKRLSGTAPVMDASTDDDLGLSPIGGGSAKLSEHVVHAGEVVRGPTEEETLVRLSEQSASDDSAKDDEGVVQVLTNVVKGIEGLKGNRRKWTSLSVFQRYALIGMEALANDALGRKQDGKSVNLSVVVGFDPRSGRQVTNG